MDSLTARVLAFALPALGIVVSGQHVSQQPTTDAEPPAQVAMLESPQIKRLAEVEAQLDVTENASAQLVRNELRITTKEDWLSESTSRVSIIERLPSIESEFEEVAVEPPTAANKAASIESTATKVATKLKNELQFQASEFDRPQTKLPQLSQPVAQKTPARIKTIFEGKKSGSDSLFPFTKRTNDKVAVAAEPSKQPSQAPPTPAVRRSGTDFYTAHLADLPTVGDQSTNNAKPAAKPMDVAVRVDPLFKAPTPQAIKIRSKDDAIAKKAPVTTPPLLGSLEFDSEVKTELPTQPELKATAKAKLQPKANDASIAKATAAKLDATRAKLSQPKFVQPDEPQPKVAKQELPQQNFKQPSFEQPKVARNKPVPAISKPVQSKSQPVQSEVAQTKPSPTKFVEPKPAPPTASPSNVARREQMAVTRPTVKAPVATAPAKNDGWKAVDLRNFDVDTATQGEPTRVAARASNEDRLQAQNAVRQGFELVQRRANFSARARFVEALRIVSRSLDDQTYSSRYSKSLRNALTAYNEAADFFPGNTRPDEDVNLMSVVSGHDTPILNEVEVDSLSSRQCLREYMAYAEQEFKNALGEEELASHALYGLGRLEAHGENGESISKHVRAHRSLTLFQTALEVDQKNYAAANELGVLLARYGKYDDAVGALEHCVQLSAQPTAWRNLSNIYRRLGRTQEARVAELEANRAMAAAPQTPFVANNQRVQWVDADTFASVPTDPNVQVAPVAAPHVQQQANAAASGNWGPKSTTSERQPVKTASKSRFWRLGRK